METSNDLFNLDIKRIKPQEVKNMSKPIIKPAVKEDFLTLEELLKGIIAEFTFTIPEDLFAHIPTLAGKTIKIRPLSRLEYRMAAEVSDRQGYPAAINLLIFKALLVPKLESIDQVDKMLGGIVIWLIGKIHQISGLGLEEGSETEKNLEPLPIVPIAESTGKSS